MSSDLYWNVVLIGCPPCVVGVTYGSVAEAMGSMLPKETRTYRMRLAFCSALFYHECAPTGYS